MTYHHAAPRQAAAPPTAKQQAYIRKLALERGISFTPPRTVADASRLIDQLRTRPADPTGDQLRDARTVQAHLAQGSSAARVREHELEGHGSSATWKRVLS